MTVLLILCVILLLLFGFYLGLLAGVKDCKKRFKIPKGACGVDEDGFIYS